MCTSIITLQLVCTVVCDSATVCLRVKQSPRVFVMLLLLLLLNGYRASGAACFTHVHAHGNHLSYMAWQDGTITLWGTGTQLDSARSGEWVGRSVGRAALAAQQNTFN